MTVLLGVTAVQSIVMHFKSHDLLCLEFQQRVQHLQCHGV